MVSLIIVAELEAKQSRESFQKNPHVILAEKVSTNISLKVGRRQQQQIVG